MSGSVEDKVTPYHSFDYETQIDKKNEWMRDILKQFSQDLEA